MKHFMRIFASLVLVGILAFSCSKKSNESGAVQRYITVKGSDTMVHLASNWAEAFMKANPEYEVSVTGGGSGTGIAALINGTTDVCIASRNIKPGEFRLAEKQGVKPLEHTVARDGIAVILNPGNPVQELTVEQIGKIYTGANTNWSQVGGPEADIVVNSRESSSGTYVFFQEHVLKKKDYVASANLLPSNAAIVQAVSQDQYAIGYVGLGYATGAAGKVKILAVKTDANTPGVQAGVAAVVSGDYPIARDLYIYTNGEARGLIKSFLDFVLSPPGQQIVTLIGEIPLKAVTK